MSSLVRHVPLRRTPLIRKKAMKPWRRPKADCVTPDVRLEVLVRDQGCVAPRLGALDECAGRLTLDHVRESACMGKRAPSDPRHLASVCWRHHLDGWATANRPALRRYLAEVEG